MNARGYLVWLVLALLAACQRQMLGQRAVWVDVPLDGAHAPPGTAVVVGAYASAPGGVQMNLYVNGSQSAALTVEQVSQGLFYGQGTWQPPGAGRYLISVEALTAEGGRMMSDAVALTVDAQPAPQVSPSPQPPLDDMSLRAERTTLAAGECTTLRWKVNIPNPQSIDLNGSPVPPEGSQEICPCSNMQYDLIVFANGEKYARSVAVQVSGSCVATPIPPQPTGAVEFWADSTQIAAGACTTLRWKVTNASRVFLMGKEVAAEGQQQVCLCASETYTLGAALTDGSKQERSVRVSVSGSCVTPQPEFVATTPAPPPTITSQPPPPPAPQPLKPGSTDAANPQQLADCSGVVLRWTPVDSPLGIQGYRVGLLRNNNGQWESVPPYDLLPDPSAAVGQYLTAGWGYRWNVWAVDGSGRNGDLSPWMYFECPLP
ncbi:MAG: hypothetical protein HPY45_15490 [Anaerolineae bacterium]|nr:hypothetical protein [Anaerolineae bacterium]